MCVCNGVYAQAYREHFFREVFLYSTVDLPTMSILFFLGGGGHALLSHNVHIMLFVICIFCLFGTPVLLSFS